MPKPSPEGGWVGKQKEGVLAVARSRGQMASRFAQALI